jgi:hypothetical protein
MKAKKALFLMCAVLLAVTTTALMADNEKEAGSEPTVRTPQRPQRPQQEGRGPVAAPGERGRGPADGSQAPRQADPRDRFQQMMEQRQQAHQAEVGKLQAILKIAQEEKATKTAAAIQRLIDEKDKQFNEQVEQVQSRLREAQQRSVEQRGQQQRPGQGTEESPRRPERPEPRTRRPAPPQND